MSNYPRRGIVAGLSVGMLSLSSASPVYAYKAWDAICSNAREAPEGQSGWGLTCEDAAGGQYAAMSFQARPNGTYDFRLLITNGIIPEDERCSEVVRCTAHYGPYTLTLREGDYTGTAESAPDFVSLECVCYPKVPPAPP
jgi:hypothetical protein